MRRILQIAALIVLWLIDGAPGCGDDHRNEVINRQVSHLNDSIMNVIGADRLQQEALDAYTVTAIQKTREFADYWAILTDTGADEAFRLQAERIIRSMFITDTVSVDMPGNEGAEVLRKPLADWIGSALKNEIITLGFSVDTAILDQPATLTGDSLYVGILKLTASETETPLHSAATNQYKCRFFIRKSPHTIIGRKEILWSAVLGDISGDNARVK